MNAFVVLGIAALSFWWFNRSTEVVVLRRKRRRSDDTAFSHALLPTSASGGREKL
jgi:hypothetical protein